MLLNGGAAALRSIPYLQDGSVSYWVYVEDAATANFTFELEAAYSDVYGKAASAGFEVIDGALTFLHDDSASGLTLADGWNQVSFELNLSVDVPAVKLSLKAVDMPVDTTCTNQDGECDDPICNNYICYLDIHTASDVYVDAMTVVDTMPVVMHEAPEDPDPCYYGHTPEEDDGDCTTDIHCSVCGAVITEGKASHTGGTATCCDKAKCSVCGKEYGDKNAVNHVGEAKWTHTADKHSKAYECCGAVVVAETEHKFTDNKCECGYEKEAEKPTEKPGTDENAPTGNYFELIPLTVLIICATTGLALMIIFRKKWLK